MMKTEIGFNEVLRRAKERKADGDFDAYVELMAEAYRRAADVGVMIWEIPARSFGKAKIFSILRQCFDGSTRSENIKK